MDSNNSKKNRLKSTGNKLMRRMGSTKSKRHAEVVGESTDDSTSPLSSPNAPDTSVSIKSTSQRKEPEIIVETDSVKSHEGKLEKSIKNKGKSGGVGSSSTTEGSGTGGIGSGGATGVAGISGNPAITGSTTSTTAATTTGFTTNTTNMNTTSMNSNPVNTPKSLIIPKSHSQPSTRPNSRPNSRIISRVQSRTSLQDDSTPSRSSHSYSNFFSSTNLQKLGLDASRPLSSRTASKIGANDTSGSFDSESPNLLYRSGSRLWEEARETKGQSWLGFRQSSESSLDQDDESPKLEQRPSYHRAYTSHEAESDIDNDDMVLHFTPRDSHSTTTKTNASNTEPSSGVIVLRAVDWLLGIKQESKGLTVALQPEVARKSLTKSDKMRQRDGDYQSTIDLAWVLAVIAGYELY